MLLELEDGNRLVFLIARTTCCNLGLDFGLDGLLRLAINNSLSETPSEREDLMLPTVRAIDKMRPSRLVNAC